MFDLNIFKKQATDFLGEKARTKKAKQQKMIERENIANAPANRADVRDLFDQQFDRWQQAYAKSLQQHLAPIVRDLASFAGPGQAENAARYLSVTSIQPGLSQQPSPRSLDIALFALLGDKLRPAFYSALDSLDWSNEGLPMAQRAAKLAEIDAELDALMRKELQLAEAAAAAGLSFADEGLGTVGGKQRARAGAA